MIIGRFAPSPTGILHLGNLRTALASWLSARSKGGRWIIRMEDVDGPRCRREFGEQQLKDLAAMGMESDSPVIWQSDRGDAYREAIHTLHGLNRLYPCHCTRKDLQKLSSAPHEEDGLRPYPNLCRHRPWEGLEAALRFRLTDGAMDWADLALGPQYDDPSTLTGDPLLFRRDGMFAYHLAVVVDDGFQGVTEIVRGMDLRGVTATQIQLQEALSVPRPAYAHLGLVTAPDGCRLGKRAGALGLEALRQRGIGTDEIIGWLGRSLGCIDHIEPCTINELTQHFQWSKVPIGKVALPESWS
ncbi:MAG: tRNA glutamyl-Q(34) synthetase GluQRS [Holophagaceae bacterium]|nr:tRNA glutamyl-Q(34) synthetase GluQRS [Holophagaceae bacterium]